MHIEVRRNSAQNAYQVVALFRPVMEEMFETMTHVALFEDAADAEALRQAVIAKFRATPYESRLNGLIDVVDRRYWQGPTSAAACMRWDAEVEPFRVPSRNRVA